MLKKNDNRPCPLTGEIVSYIYGEAGELGEFETHLAACTVCIDELAAVSNARYSVYEWHREDFAPLATPAFEIPVSQTVGAASGWFAGLRTFWGLANLPVAVAALVLVAIGIGFVMIGTPDGRENNIVANTRPDVIVPPEIVTPSDTPDALRAEGLPGPGSASPTAVRISQPVARSARKPLKQRSESPYAKVPAKRGAPVLSDFDDPKDKGLRLTDIFDGGGQ